MAFSYLYMIISCHPLDRIETILTPDTLLGLPASTHGYLCEYYLYYLQVSASG
jgi:hypothetical protein